MKGKIVNKDQFQFKFDDGTNLEIDLKHETFTFTKLICKSIFQNDITKKNQIYHKIKLSRNRVQFDFIGPLYPDRSLTLKYIFGIDFDDNYKGNKIEQILPKNITSATLWYHDSELIKIHKNNNIINYTIGHVKIIENSDILKLIKLFSSKKIFQQFKKTKYSTLQELITNLSKRVLNTIFRMIIYIQKNIEKNILEWNMVDGVNHKRLELIKAYYHNIRTKRSKINIINIVKRNAYYIIYFRGKIEKCTRNKVINLLKNYHPKIFSVKFRSSEEKLGKNDIIKLTAKEI